MDENKKIVLNIENIDTKEITEQEQLLQEDAYRDLRALLKEDVKNRPDKEDIIEQRTHNTIFINGKRGSGKTQFLLSIEKHLKKYYKGAKKENFYKKLYFFRPIDPTLLHKNESFLTIVIAKVLNNLEMHGKLTNLTTKQKKKFYKNLNNVAEAIDGVFNNKDKTALEVIAQDQTSLKLEQYTHAFFKNVAGILKKKKLILLIDDVDMAFEKGFEVLEVIRKYLSTPYVTPIVTGNIELYETIVNDNFSKKINDKNLEKEMLERISIDYLIKIFPTNKRIKLKSLYTLKQEKYEIYFKGYKKNLTIEDLLKKICNKNIFGQEMSCNSESERGLQYKKFQKNLLENQLRRLVQFFHAKKNEKLFGLESISQMKMIEKDFFLDLLTEVESFETLIKDGESLLINENYKQAKLFFLKALRKAIKDEQKEKVYNYLGNIAKALNEYKDAIKAYKKSIEYNFDYSNDDVYTNLGYSYLADKENRKAIEAYSQAVDINPNNDIAYYFLGRSHFNLKEYDKAIKAYTTSSELNPQDEYVYKELASIYTYRQEYQKAIEYYEKALEINSQDASIHTKIANIYKIKKDYIEAENYYKQAIELDSENPSKYYDLGEFYYVNLEKYDEAKKAYEQAYILSSNDLSILRKIGNSYYMMQEYDNAINVYNQILEIDPKYPIINHNLGHTYNVLENYTLAIKYFLREIEISPAYENTYIALKNIYLKQLELNPENQELKEKIEELEKKIKEMSKDVTE